MKEIIAYHMVSKAGLPSSAEKAGLVVDEVIRDPPHVDYWSMSETADGVDWVDVEGPAYSAEDITRLYQLLNEHLHACREGACTTFRVEDWEDGNYRVAVSLMKDDVETEPGEGGPVPPYAAEVIQDAQRALTIRIAKWSLLAAVVIGGGYWLVKRKR